MTRITTFIPVLALALLSSTGFAQEPARPASAEIVPARLEVQVGETGTFTARGLDAQGRAIAGAVIRWLSSNADVVVVDEAGVVTGVRPGEARIAAVVNGVAAIATVVVPQLPPASIELALPGGDVQAGASAPLSVAVRTRLGDPLPDAAVTFASSDEAVARVDAAGRVYGRRPGAARGGRAGRGQRAAGGGGAAAPGRPAAGRGGPVRVERRGGRPGGRRGPRLRPPAGPGGDPRGGGRRERGDARPCRREPRG